MITKKEGEDKGLTVFGGSLAILSTIVGGGVVGLPYSFYHTGIPVGIMMNILFAIMTLYSCILYIKAKDLVGNLASFSEIGFILQGRKSVFIISVIVFVGCN